MKKVKGTGVVFLCLIILILSLVPEQVYASGGFEGLFPTEGEMGYPCSGGNDSDMSECNEFTGYEYKKYPSGHYGWDTVHVWFRLRGIIPEMGNVDELMISSIAGFWNGINIILTRFAIFFLQFGFARGELFTKPLLEIDSTLQPIKYYVYDNLFFLAALGLAIIVVVLYARGRIGEAYGAIFKAAFVSAIMMLIVDNASFVILTIWNMVDFVTLTVLGLVNLSPVHMESSIWVAQSKIVEISNTIFSIYVDQPWSFGQFNSMEAPIITSDESRELRKLEINIDSNVSTWKEAMLDYPAKSDERVAMVEVLTNDEFSHDGSLDTTMLERGGLTRILIAFTSSLLAVSGFILFGATSLLQVLSNIGILILLIFLGSMIIFSFFNDLGLRIIYKYAGFIVLILCLKIAAAIFIGIPMLVFQLLNLSGIKYLLASSLHIFVNILAIVFLPFIWKTMTPALVSGAVRVTQSMVSGGAAPGGAGGGDRRTMPPEIRTESQRGNFEQAKWYRERKQSREKQKEAKVQEQEIVTEIPKIKSKQNQALTEDNHKQTTTKDSSAGQTEQPANNTTPYRTARKQKTTEQTDEKAVSAEESQKMRENRKKIIEDLASNPRKIKTKGFPKNKA